MPPTFVPILHWKLVLDKSKLLVEQRAMVEKLEQVDQQLKQQRDNINILVRHVRDGTADIEAVRGLLDRYHNDGETPDALDNYDNFLRETMEWLDRRVEHNDELSEFLNCVRRKLEGLRANVTRLNDAVARSS